jgi:hypothetical protein
LRVISLATKIVFKTYIIYWFVYAPLDQAAGNVTNVKTSTVARHITFIEGLQRAGNLALKKQMTTSLADQ